MASTDPIPGMQAKPVLLLNESLLQDTTSTANAASLTPVASSACTVLTALRAETLLSSTNIMKDRKPSH
eukprot:20314-Heterococcus_DN1.PRE.4